MVAESKALTPTGAASLVEKVVIEGDLGKLSPGERVQYYRQVCDSLGLNPLTKPFDYIVLNGKLTLYARKDAADQLRKRDGVSVTGLDAQIISDVYVVKASARISERTDMATGAVSIKGLSGEQLANAMLKAETKAKRRVTLSICGLGMLDETEVADVADARPAHVDMQTGEVAALAQPVNLDAMPLCERIKDPAALKGFWSFCHKLNLPEADVYATLKTEHLHECTIPVAEAKRMLTAKAADLFDEQDEHSTVLSGETA